MIHRLGNDCSIHLSYGSANQGQNTRFRFFAKSQRGKVKRGVTFGVEGKAENQVQHKQAAKPAIVNSLPPINGSVQLEIVVGRDPIETFGNNGLLYMPMPVSNPAGNSLISLTVSKLKSAWPTP